MRKFFTSCFIFFVSSVSVSFAETNNDFVLHGLCSHYISPTGEEYYTGDCSNDAVEKLVRNVTGRLIRAKTRCYYIQVDRNANCPDYQTGTLV